MKLSLVVPIYNEAHHLAEFLERIDAFQPPCEKELILVDDCSTDGSSEILERYAFRNPVVRIRHEKNRGKGAATITGFERATGDFIGVQDADFEYDPRDIPLLLAPLMEDRADVVYGSRFKASGVQVHRTYHFLVNRFLTLLSNLCSGLYLTDMETCYKFFRRDVLMNVHIESQRFGFEPEITAKIAHLRIRVMEIPISYFPRNYLQGKKITWKDGVAAIRHILYYNFAVKPSDYLKPELPRKYLPHGGNWL
jgi:glycosyltransferase involved in cell wall biosynthesis